MEIFELIFSLAQSTLRFTPILIFAAMAGVFSERAGIIDIGLEGKLLIGAFVSATVAHYAGFGLVGLFAAMAVCMVFGWLHGLATITFRGDHVISGLAINFLAVGLTKTIGHSLFAKGGDTPNLAGPDSTGWERLQSLIPKQVLIDAFPGLEGSKALLNILSLHGWLIALAFIAVGLTWFVLNQTRFGLRLRFVGEEPQAVDTAGASVIAYRFAAVTIAGALCGIGGAYLSTSNIASFTPKMSADMGYLALAAVVFGKWRPFHAMLGCLLFGLLFALKNRLNSVNEGFLVQVPGQLFEALPYVLVVVVLAGFVGSARAPKAIGRPYVKERE
jgi:simple sugar transport system permease protein